MKKIKYLMTLILTFCIVTAPSYIVSADNIENNKVNIAEDNSQEIIYHIDAVTHEVTVQTVKEKSTNFKRSNTDTEANVGEYIPEHLMNEQEEGVTPRYLCWVVGQK